MVVTSAEIVRCTLAGACQAVIIEGRGVTAISACDAGDCGRPLNAEFLAVAADKIIEWRNHRWWKGEVLTLGAMIDQVKDRWPTLSVLHARQVIAAADERSRGTAWSGAERGVRRRSAA